MSLSTRLSTLKASQLKYAAFLMGIPSTGTKMELASTIRHQIETGPHLQRAQRIVSVDMGIRNLGICVLQNPIETFDKSSDSLSVKVTEWKRMSVALYPSRAVGFEEAAKRQAKSTVDPSAFNPSNLSKTAVEVAEGLLKYDPTHILIERQRFRSGGGSAVQEWTLRVNALESMLWASFETMSRKEKVKSFPRIHEMSPARVARFWCAPPFVNGTEASEALLFGPSEPLDVSRGSVARDAKRNVDKKEKIAMARSWLSTDSATSSKDVALEFSKEAQETADVFLSRNGRSSRRSSKTSEVPTVGGGDKLDDLADCLLQGMAWLRWQSNQERIAAMFNRDSESRGEGS